MTIAELKNAVERLNADDLKEFCAWVGRVGADRLARNGDYLPHFKPSDDVLRRAVKEALDDPRPSIPAEQVFDRLEQRYRQDVDARTRKA